MRRTYLDDPKRALPLMAKKPARSGAPKKPRHTAAQKKAARMSRGEPTPDQSRQQGGDERTKSPRWSEGTRQARGHRPSGRARDEAAREDRAYRDGRTTSPSYGERDQRRSYGDRDQSRSFGDRDQRRSYGDRDQSRSSADRSSRPAYGDREQRRSSGDRDQSRSFADRSSGPAYGDREQRRSSGDRPERGGAPRRNDFDRGHRSERQDRRRDGGSEHREHTFRTHREEFAGRPDRRERQDVDRRPSRRDRAEHEANRHERTDRPQRTPRPDRTERPMTTRPAAGPVPVTEDNGFAALGLHGDLVAALARQGIATPFPIQTATIPDALAGRDLLGRGQTGSGKTMAFGLPALHRLAELDRARPHKPHAVILTPTRELAMQIVDALKPLMSAMRLRHQLIAGGMSYTPQLRSLDEGVDVLVATPGRLSDLIERGAADLSDVRITVLDEADHMAEMGFVEAISEILDLTPESGQRLLFSATLDHGVDKIAARYLHDPVTHSTDDARASVSTMDHHVFLVHPHDKKTVTAAIANRTGRTLVFVRTKLGADRVALQLRESGVFAAALHGGLNQAQRTRVLEAFKASEIPVLVATDVAARGIHVDDVSLVLQVDPPADHKDYLHRSGRTARAGEDGVVVTLALPHQKRQLSRMLEAAGVDARPVNAGPEDQAVIETAGGRMPSGEVIPQSRLDDVLRPPRRQGGRPGYRGGRPGGRQGGRGGGRPTGGRSSYRPRREAGERRYS
ncbi:DEAD/DEAH box helicase [Ornithinimicrobium sediminis]|uniref:DEAD/DEAH box helicase n=1 Tax=Ornithinimicrobium sediminis TaxID=2904603 RepID=UPI001E289F41|nr:DEAD/DEAH box helicase [Ornithinimicrobium sediminis]MCE0487988.1 DEAD/DEAH box helicase [Ornithinimicrobium sediminis]